MEHRGRKQNIEIKEKINKLVVAGYSFQDIADTLGINSRQLARYHWRKYKGLPIYHKKLSTIKGINK